MVYRKPAARLISRLLTIPCVALLSWDGAAADKSRYSLLEPAPVALRRAYNTDRPSKTDSPFTIDAGVFQIESDVVSWTRNTGEGARVHTWTVGQTNLKLGLTNRIDLQLIAQSYIDRLKQNGYGDTAVRLKVNLVGNDGGTFVAGVVGSLKMPTNQDHLGNSVYEPGIGLPISMSLPAGFTLFGQTRLDFLDQAASSSRRLVSTNSAGFSRTIIGKLSGYAEFYSAVSSGHGYPWIGTLDGGLIYQLTSNCSLDVNIFYGLTDSADDLNVLTGFGCRF